MINNNSEVTKELRDVLKIQGGSDKLIDQVGNIIQPVVNINPKHSRVINIVKHLETTNNGGNIYTTPTDRDFYLYGVACSRIKNATSDNTDSGVSFVLESGETVYPIVLAGITTTAQNDNMVQQFETPIKLKKGTTIVTFKTSTTLGTERLSGMAWGYIDPNSSA